MMKSQYAKLEDLEKENLQLRQEMIEFKARAQRLIDAYKLEVAELKRAGDTYQADVQGFYPPEKTDD